MVHTSLLTSLLLLILSARLLGQLVERFNQPAIIGEMAAGILLGPSVFGIIHASPALQGISELAVFLVVLSAGLEMNFKDVMGVLKGRGVVVAILAFLLPLILGIGVGLLFRFDPMRSFFLGLCLSITALPVSIRLLESMNLLNDRIGKYAIAAAIVSDLGALLFLGIILTLPAQRTLASVATSIGLTGAKLIGLVSLVLVINWILEKLPEMGVHVERFPERMVRVFGAEALFGIVVLFVLAFGSVSEALGFHFVIGAFFGGLLIDKKFFFASRYSDLERTIHSVTGGFLAPVFFAYLGLEFNFTAVESFFFVALVLLVSMGSKILAGRLGGILTGLPKMESYGIGVMLNGRGVMDLVVASIALQRGFIEQGLFSTLVLVGVTSTVVTPFLFRKWILPKLEHSTNPPVEAQV